MRTKPLTEQIQSGGWANGVCQPIVCCKTHVTYRLDNIIGGFAQYQRLQSSNDDDPIDRLNHIYTVTLLVVFSIFVSGKQFIGNPIECFSGQEELRLGKLEYAKVFCWLRNTYVVGRDEFSDTSQAMPVRVQDRQQAEIHYYQWVPIMLLVMAGLFKLPNLVWRVFSLGSGLDLNQLTSLVISTQCAPTDKYRETVKHIAEYLDRWLEGHRPRTWNIFMRVKKFLSKRCFMFLWGRRFGTYLTGLSLLTKFMFACVDISVFVILQHVMGGWYSLYGFQLLAGLFSSSGLPKDSSYFPKVTFCDMDVRQMSNVQRTTLQCVLPINIFNEKIFTFLWFWMCALTVATVANFLYWASLWAFGNLYCTKTILVYFFMLNSFSTEKPKGPPKNLRPMTFLNTIRKALSKIVLERIRPHVEQYLSHSQSGFRPNRSTSDVAWTHKWLAAKVNIENIAIKIAGIDMSAAFDT
ncbi:innexin [Elysia marginata]|uniref:Innexin n=1 Tax=Elysia marginata TaxID=1093978 RepID=A0AAV4JGH4_9GAST|nr:innexin [Elysia marginata]